MNDMQELSHLIVMAETTISQHEQEMAALQGQIDGLDAELDEQLSLLNAELENYIRLLKQEYRFKQQEAKDGFIKRRQDLENHQAALQDNILFATNQLAQHKKQLSLLQAQSAEREEAALAEQRKQEKIRDFPFQPDCLIYRLGETDTPFEDETEQYAVYYRVRRLDTYNNQVVIFADKCRQMPRLGKMLLKKTDELILYAPDYEGMLVHNMDYEIRD